MAIGERDKMARAMLQEASSSREGDFCDLGIDRCYIVGT